MSALLGLVQTTAQVVASVSPSPSPTVTPAVHHAATVVSTPGNSITDILNALASKISVSDLMAAAGALVVGFQYLVNSVPFIKNLEDRAAKTFNWVVSFLLPLLGAFLASVVSGHNDLGVAPYLYLIAQFIYFVIEYIKSKATTAQKAPTFQAPEF